jgi:TonB family protein
MGYQALLFCPDEKTARTVTQVLGELDFTVIPCTEPFAAVKKLMGEHFDAVVVDCDNEQNATLLFKSARNTANNQSALAVAVVEGQAGVAKAFRIGANLVLTKPINVEQAKGTLRVARGLLRKNETAKSTTPTTPAPAKLATPTPAKPVLVTPPAATGAASPKPWVVSNTPPAPAAPTIAASAVTNEESVKPAVKVTASAPTSTSKISSDAIDEPKAAGREIVAPPQKAAVSPARSAGFGSGAASAPAPAKELGVSKPERVSADFAELESHSGILDDAITSTDEESVSPAPSFTFGGAITSETESTGGGSKKAFLAVAAVVIVAAGSYGAWTYWGRSTGENSAPASVTAKPVTTSTPSPQAAPAPTPITPAVSVPSSVTSSTPGSSTSAQSAGSAKAPAVNAENAHPGKSITVADSPKSTVSVVAANKAPEEVETSHPIVIKNNASKPAAKAIQPGDAAAPSLTAIAPASAAPLPNLTGGTRVTRPVLQTLSVSQGVSQGLLIKKPQPTYPPNALRMRIEGSVLLLATISKEGDISAVKVLSGDTNLAKAAAEAVKQWKYKPYLLNGEPVEIQTQVTVNFKLPR